MAPRWPGPKPGGDVDLLDYLDDWLLSLVGLDDVADEIADAFRDFASIVRGVPIVGGALSDILNDIADFIHTTDESAQTAQQTANNAQTAIDELTATVSGDTAGAETATFTFVGADGAALSSTDFTTLVSGLVIRGNTAGIDSGAGSTVRPAVLCNTAFTGDGQEVSVVLGSSGQSDQSTWILFGLNTAGTEAVAAELRTDGCALRRITRSGSTWATAQTWSTSSAGFSNGQRATIARRTGESIYRLTRNGAPVITYDDSANTHPRTSGYWRAGFREERTPDIFGVVTYDSFRVNSFRVTDYGTAAASVGTGWRLVRSNTANGGTTSWTTTGVALATGTFDTTDRLSGATVEPGDLGIGRVHITKAGFYVLSVGGEFNGGTPSAGRWLGILTGPSTGSMSCHSRSAPTGTGTVSISGSTGQGGSDFHTHSFSGSGNDPGNAGAAGCFVAYLAAGDYVQPCGGSVSGSANMGLRGSADGSKTYFTGAYLGTQ